jgi:3-deoxy-7-phosphoheptulonate synthase
MTNLETDQQYQTDDVRIIGMKELALPNQILGEFPASPGASRLVFETKQQIHRILHGTDDRLLAIVGPCSIHDVKAAKEYAGRLIEMKQRLADRVLIVMRVYFEKPRTTIGWKGLINDPNLDGSFEINQGLRVARRLLVDLNEMGIPAGCEFLDMITPQYTADLVSWGAIGARTTESQIHREMASGLSSPVGFKNGTDGNVRIAVDAIRSAAAPHHFIGVTKEGQSAIVATKGNEDCHLILRGGIRPNYDSASVVAASRVLAESGVVARLMIDFSHGNSSKMPERQINVCQDVVSQIATGNGRIFGIMVESHLNAGRQDLVPGKELAYGVSITDACIGWDDTVGVLNDLAEAVTLRRNQVVPES